LERSFDSSIAAAGLRHSRAPVKRSPACGVFAELVYFADNCPSYENERQCQEGLAPKQRDELLAVLKARFDANKVRHPDLVWAKVQAR